MRSGLNLAGILLALAIVVLLIKKQLQTPQLAIPSAVQPNLSASIGNVPQQSQQIQQQVQQQLDAAMEQRPKPEDFE